MISYIVLIMLYEYYWCALSTYRQKVVWKTLVCWKREILRCSLIAMNRLQNCESLLVFPSWTFNRWGARRSNRLDSKTDLNSLMWIWGSPRIQWISITKSLLNHWNWDPSFKENIQIIRSILFCIIFRSKPCSWFLTCSSWKHLARELYKRSPSPFYESHSGVLHSDFVSVPLFPSGFLSS